MRTTLLVLVAILALAPSTCQASPESDLCATPEFRAAFLANQQDIPFDYLDVSSGLIAFGDAALPCLRNIAQDDGSKYGLSGCVDEEDGCAVWAVRAMAEIGTPKAIEELSGVLQTSVRPRPILVALGQLRAAGVRKIRPEVLSLLAHNDPQVKAGAIVTLGWIGDRHDFEAMLDATLTLPDEALYRAATGLEQLRDPRAIEPLAERARTVRLPIEREQLEKRIAKMRAEFGGN